MARKQAMPPNAITAGFGGARNGVQRSFCATAIQRAEVSLWSMASRWAPSFEVRFNLQSDRLLRRREMTLCAITDQSASQQKGMLFDQLIGSH
jgi:hypothetical protein